MLVSFLVSITAFVLFVVAINIIGSIYSGPSVVHRPIRRHLPL
jgi:hypothetical protein